MGWMCRLLGAITEGCIMTSLKTLLSKIQTCPEGQIKDALCETYEILEWFYTWLENIEESISKES